MHQVGVHTHFGSGRTAAEEIDYAAPPQQPKPELPNFGEPNGFNHHVGAAACGEIAHDAHWIGMVVIQHGFVGSHGGSAVELRLPPPDGDHPGFVNRLGQKNEHHADGPQTDDRDAIAGTEAGFFQSPNNARQRLHESRVLIGDVVGDLVHVLLNDASGNADVLRIGSVVEQQILA